MFPLPALVSFLLLVPSGLGRPQDYQDGQPSDIVNGGTTEAAVESSKATDLVSEATAMATEWQTEVGAEGEASETSALGSSVTAEPTTSAELPSESSATTTPVDEVPAPPVPSVGDLGPVPYMILRSKRHPAHCLAIDDEPSIWGPAKLTPCATGGDAIKWKFAWGLTQVQSAVQYNSTEWCLDGGEGTDMRLPVTANACGTTTASMKWWFTGEQDGHLAMYQQARCLDLEDGVVDGDLQTWQCFFGNWNQMWHVQDPSQATEDPEGVATSQWAAAW